MRKSHNKYTICVITVSLPYRWTIISISRTLLTGIHTWLVKTEKEKRIFYFYDY